MTLAIETTAIDFDDWATTDLPTVEAWLHTLWGIRPGTSSPTCSTGKVHPSCLASADWLTTLYGFSI
jgi:hypothetical protein